MTDAVGQHPTASVKTPMATILIADDSLVIQRLLGLTLQRAGHIVETADDGQIALEMLEQELFDLLIADLAMPGVDGLMLVRQVRADPRFAALPVIMLTSSGEDGDRLSADAEGVNAFLTKPASSTELIETVNRLL